MHKLITAGLSASLLSVLAGCVASVQVTPEISTSSASYQTTGFGGSGSFTTPRGIGAADVPLLYELAGDVSAKSCCLIAC
ncbi:MAG: hypothetical protein AAFX02_01410 [Pseudomonadota bacterium]